MGLEPYRGPGFALDVPGGWTVTAGAVSGETVFAGPPETGARLDVTHLVLPEQDEGEALGAQADALQADRFPDCDLVEEAVFEGEDGSPALHRVLRRGEAQVELLLVRGPAVLFAVVAQRPGGLAPEVAERVERDLVQMLASFAPDRPG